MTASTLLPGEFLSCDVGREMQVIPSRHLELRRHCLEFKKTKDYTLQDRVPERRMLFRERTVEIYSGNPLEDSAEYWSRHALEAGKGTT